MTAILRSGIAVLLLAGLIIIFSPFSCDAEELIVNLKADRLRYDEKGGVVAAEGSVEARLENFVVHSDSLRIDVASKVVTAEGNVSLERDDYSAQSDSLTYNSSLKISMLSKFYAIFKTKDIKGNVMLRIDEFYDEPGRQWGTEGDATTCDYDRPHYDVRAKRFEYYPGDKLVGFSVTFYLNGVPVMWFPYWIYSFKNKRASLMPVIGHNEVEGDFAKFAFDYFMNNDQYGLIYIDLMQKKGLGKGIEHAYRMNENNSGVFYVYHLEERDTGDTDIVAKVNHKVDISPDTKLNILSKYSDIYLVPYGRLDQTYNKFELIHSSDRKYNATFDFLEDRYGGFESYNLNLSHSYLGYDTSSYTSFSRGEVDPAWSRFNERFSHRQPLFRDNMTFSTIINFIRNSTNESVGADERLEPQVEFLDREDEYSIRVFSNWRLDTDGELWKADANDEYLERKPEVTVSLKPRDLQLFTLNSSFSFAQFHETRWNSTLSLLRDFTAERYNANVSGSKSVDLPLGSRLSVSAGLEQYYYSPGDERYVLTDSVGISTDLGGFFSNSVNYQKGISEGNTPFYFDIIGVDRELITDSMTFYYRDLVRWTTSSGYNYRTSLYNDILTTLKLRPDPRLEGSVSTGYDPNRFVYRDLVFSLRMRPHDRLSWNWDSVHDINNNIFKSASSVLDADIGDDWRSRFHVRVAHSYDYFTGQFIMRDLMVVKDLHCWEMKFIYSDWRKEWRISFTLNAFPSQPVGWGAGDRGYFFEGFSMPNYMQQSPARN